MPVLAVSAKLKRRGAKLLFIGSTKPADREAAEGAGLAFAAIQAGKLRRYFSLAHVTDPFRVLVGYRQARRIIQRFQPQVVFAKGGYVSLPVVRAAARLGVPVVIHESDVVPGLANRLAARSAAKIAVSWPVEQVQRAGRFSADKLVYTGNPIRDGVSQGTAERARKQFHFDAKLPTVLVLGGSQGSRAVNKLVRGALPNLLKEAQVIHQVGPRAAAEIAARVPGVPTELRKRYQARGFLGEEQFDVYAAADLVIARAGANTLAEIAAAGKPSILIPLPSAASDHQRANAKVFEQAGAAVVLEEAGLEPDRLARTVRQLLSDPAQRENMSRAARKLAKLDAAEKLAELVWRTGKRHG